MRIDQYFDNNFDCYTCTTTDCLSEMAVSKSKFIDLVWNLIPNDKQLDEAVESYKESLVENDKPIKSEKIKGEAKKHFTAGFQAAILLISNNCK